MRNEKRYLIFFIAGRLETDEIAQKRQFGAVKLLPRLQFHFTTELNYSRE